MGKTTLKIEQKDFVGSFLNAVTDHEYLAHAIELENLCKEGTVLASYFCFKIGSEYFVMNLNNGLCISWFETFGTRAWVNRPQFTRKELVSLFESVLSETQYAIN